MFYPNYALILIGICSLLLASCSGMFEAFQPAGTGGLGDNSLPTVDSTNMMQFTSEPFYSPTDSSPSGPPVIDIENSERVAEVESIEVQKPNKIKWADDNKTIGVQTAEGINLYDTETMQTLSSVAIGAGMILDYSMTAKLMAVTQDQQNIELREISTAQLIRTLALSDMSLSASFSPDGRYLAVSSAEDIAVSIWDTSNGQQVANLVGFQTAAPVYSAYFTSDGTHIIWQARATLQMMDITTREFGEVLSHEEFVAGVALSPDGKVLAAGSAAMIDMDYKGVVDLWEPMTGNPLGALITGDSIAQSVAFSPDGRILAGGAGNILVLWDVQNQQELVKRLDHVESINSVAFSPDGTVIATAGGDNTVRLYESSW